MIEKCVSPVKDRFGKQVLMMNFGDKKLSKNEDNSALPKLEDEYPNP